MKNGETFSAYRESPLGWAENPVSASDVREKYWRNIEFSGTVSRTNAAKALALLDQIEEIDDASTLTDCLASR
jgi:hypothetical protein